MGESRRVLLTGASGYVGGRLLPLLEARGVIVRCLARTPANLEDRVSVGNEIVAGDVLDYPSLIPAMAGIDTAYYLVHSMGSRGSFEHEDRIAAQNFANAAREAGVRRIVYLGGLGDDDDQLSPHLRSRHEVGEVLKKSGCVVLEFRASIVIGSGSLSFELVRALVQRLPVMICPKWVGVKAQPIAVEDLLEYLLEALDWSGTESRVFEIGGPKQVSYGEVMREYSRLRGLRRWFVSVPVLTPRLSSLWLGLVTPIYARVGRKLIDSMRNPTIVKDDSALRDFDIQPRGLTESIQRALVKEDHAITETRWSDALSSARGVRRWGGVRFGNRIVDSRDVTVKASPECAFGPIRRIGGKQGWYFADLLWSIRGGIDLLCGGVGKRRARRDPELLRVGDVLDWWRVEEFIPNRRLRLSAEMKVPGRAWLEFEVTPEGNEANIRQTAIFDPVGLAGLAYWYSLYPIHAVIFRGMLGEIANRAESDAKREPSLVTSS
ncbi:MAG: SDR family oxidoreductase [Planctomycetaceae bacterium]|nr:SDR family oxidoreductase [Planctomycetaceae bacterium]